MPTDAELLKIIGFFLVVGIYIYFLKKGFKQKLKKVTFSQSQIEENLKELQQYQSLSENMVGMLALVDSNYKINLANSAYEQAYSKGDYSLLGSSIIETVGIGDFEEFLKDKIDCSFQGECVDDQLWINFPQSGRKYMRFSYTPVEIESQIKYVAVHALDFTQDKLNEENLAKHKHQYQTIFNCMQDGFALFQGVKEKEITADYSIIDVNPAFEKILNQKAEFLIGKKIQNVFPNYSKDWVSFFHRIIRTSIPEKIELEFQETQQIFELFVFPLEKNQIATIVKDITNSKIVEKLKETHSEDLEQQEKNLHYEVLLRTEVEDQLRDSLKKLQDMMTALDAHSIVAITNHKGLITYINQKFCDISQYTKRELIGKDHRIVKSGHHSKEFIANLWSTIKKGKIWNGVIKNRKKMGDFYWLNTTIVPIKDEEGVPYQFITIRTDITETITSQEKLKKSEEEVRNILETANEGFWVLDNDYVIQKVNPAMCQILQRSEDEIIGKPFLDFFDDTNHALFLEKLESEENNHYKPYEIALTQKNGDQVFCLFSETIILNQNQVKEGSFAMITNIHDKKVSQNELYLAKKKAEMANQAKTQFLANMSHEIRTPLNAIIGFSQILMKRMKNTPTSSEEKQYLTNIKTSGQNLSELINNILDLSKIEAGKMILSEEEVDLKQLVQSIFHINKAHAVEKKIDFNYDFDRRIPKYILIDRTKINQILMNLTTNAIKFTPKEKKVLLNAKLGSDGQILFQVTDEGIGIQEDRQEAIFKAFEQADNATTREFGGTGLGLSITKKMVELLGGNIRLDSAIGKGSTFEVQIPLKTIKKDTSKLNEPVDENIRFSSDNVIVVAEDNPLNQQMIQILLEDLGLKIHLAQNGKEAVQKTKELHPDLVIMDMHMPVMDGAEATKIIRSFDDVQDTPIIALSADAFTEQQKKACGYGLNHYLTKPIDFDKLVPILSLFLKKEDNKKIQVNQELKSLPSEVEQIIHIKLQELEKVPIYFTDQLIEKIDDIQELCSPYESSYADYLNTLKELVFTGNEEQFQQLLQEDANA